MYGRALGRAITHLRGDRTQAACAIRADLDAAAWSAYETGRREPYEGNLRRIAQGLGCSQLELEATAWRFRRAKLEGERPAPSTEPAELLARLVTLFEELLFLTSLR